MINEMDIEKMSLDPPTNRGPVPTYKSVSNPVGNGVYLLFDWIQVTIHPFLSDFNADEIKDLGPVEYLNFIKTKYFYDESNIRIHDVYDLFWYLFRIDRSKVKFNEEKALFGYEYCYSYFNLKIFESTSRLDMGIHIYLTGSGCREFESYGLDYVDFFLKLSEFNPHYTRIDVDFDSFTDKYWTLDKINNCLLNHGIVSKFRSRIDVDKREINSLSCLGKTIQFGNRSSDIQFTFYDKILERQSNDFIVDENIKFWFRFEMRFRNDKAQAIIDNYLYYSSNNHYISMFVVPTCNSFSDYMKGIASNYISFRVINSSDSNRWRWPFKSWWKDFIYGCDKIQFQKKPVEYSITKKRNWLESFASKSLFMVWLSQLEDYSFNDSLKEYIFNYFEKGFDKLDNKDLNLVNQKLISDGLNPLSLNDVNDIITNIKEVLLKR